MKLQENARALRAGMTDAERHLWYLSRDGRLQGAKLRRQQPMGKYIADFVCIENRLVVELDGIQHLDSVSDVVRNAWFVEQRWRVLRFWNDDVLLRTNDVLEQILLALNWRPPSPGGVAPPSPASGRGDRQPASRGAARTIEARTLQSPLPSVGEGAPSGAAEGDGGTGETAHSDQNTISKQ